jgi:hypothetical protein
VRVARTLQRYHVPQQCESNTYFSEGGTVNDFISGVEDRFHFFDTFVVPHEDEAKSSICRPCLLHSVVDQKVRQLLERRHRRILHHDELLDAIPPLPIGGAGMLSLLFLRMVSLSWRLHSLMMIGGGLITPSLSVGLPTMNRSSMTLLTTGTEEVSPLALAATRIGLRIRS